MGPFSRYLSFACYKFNQKKGVVRKEKLNRHGRDATDILELKFNGTMNEK